MFPVLPHLFPATPLRACDQLGDSEDRPPKAATTVGISSSLSKGIPLINPHSLLTNKRFHSSQFLDRRQLVALV
jgi:hypothetical protein